MTDVVNDIKGFVDTNWDTGIIAKPTFTVRPTRKVHRVHTANTIYFYDFEVDKPKDYFFTRDIYWRFRVLFIGTSLANVQNMKTGFEDAIHEYKETAGRTYQDIILETDRIFPSRAGRDYRMRGYVHVKKYGESIAT